MKNNETEKKLEIPLSLRQCLEFKDICPVWSSKLRLGLDEQDLKILAHDSKYCIVGEAWGYTGRQAGYYMAPLISLVGCWECVKLGREMGKIAKEFGALTATDHLQPTICYFVKHWNLKHSPISERFRLHKIWKNLRFKLHFNGQKETKIN
jgi:hypothetical protein